MNLPLSVSDRFTPEIKFVCRLSATRRHMRKYEEIIFRIILQCIVSCVCESSNADEQIMPTMLSKNATNITIHKLKQSRL